MLDTFYQKVVNDLRLKSRLTVEDKGKVMVYAPNGCAVMLFEEPPKLLETPRYFLIRVKKDNKKKQMLLMDLELLPGMADINETQNLVLAAYKQVAKW